MVSRIDRDAAEAILKIVEADARTKIEAAGAKVWTKIGDDDESVVLIIKVTTDEAQTELNEFFGQEE